MYGQFSFSVSSIHCQLSSGSWQLDASYIEWMLPVSCQLYSGGCQLAASYAAEIAS